MRPARRTMIGAGIVLMIVALFVFWSWREGAVQRALGRLPAGERAKVYLRELDSLRSLCDEGPRQDALQKQCDEKAEFLIEFPECDEGCRRLAWRIMHIGRR